MRAVDTNVIVRMVTRDDVAQAQSADRFAEGGAWVSVLAFAEAVWVLKRIYQFTASEQVIAIEMLLKHQDLVIQDPETIHGALDLFRERPALGFSDCLVLQLAKDSGHMPLGTFDRKLAKVSGAQRI